MQHVYVLTLPESFASGVFGAKDILSVGTDLLDVVDGRVNDARPAFRTELVGSEQTVETKFGPSLTMDRVLSEAGPADVVYVAPLLLQPGHLPSVSPEVIDWLHRQYAAGAVICAACTGTIGLAASGLLDHVPATTHWAFTDTFRQHFPAVELQARRTLVVGGRDKRVVTAGAHASWHDLMLYLIHRFAGAAAARRIAKIFLLDWHELDQNAYATFRENRQHGDNIVLDAQTWLADNLSCPDPVEAVIERSRLPQRSFHRRFRQATGHTPIRYMQHLRVEYAKDLLENTELNIEQIAWQTGYQDSAYFRRLFNRITGVTPARYRKAFRTPANVAELLGG